MELASAPSMAKSVASTRERSIIHLNIADFAAVVEINLMPSLKGYPLVIAPSAPRAVVYDMSEQAYREGIRKGMSLARARRINKNIRILPPRFNRYEQVMKEIFKESLTYTPAIESGLGDGHLFLDVTGTSRLFGPPMDVAFRLKREIQKKFYLDPIWSVATNKLVAKVASRMVKPAGEFIVGPGEEEAFLDPLSICLLPGLSRAEIARCWAFNLFLISQIRTLSLAQLSVPFDRRARYIHRLVRGIDTTPVTPVTLVAGKEAFIRADHEFAEDTNDAGQLRAALYFLVETFCRSLRCQNRVSKQVSLTLSYSDGGHNRVSGKLISPTANEMLMFKHVIDLLFRAWTRRIRIRHICLASTKLLRPETQLPLFALPGKEENQEKILGTLDRIRAKFGVNAIRTGLTLEEPFSQRQ
jgi:DNA polymerase IV